MDEAIEYYLKKPNRKFPWLGYAYRDKAFYLKKENNLKLALEFQTKSCEEHKKDFKKVKINDRKGNLITCYYFLSAYLYDNNLLEESIDISTKAINLFEEFKSNNYYINEYVGSKSLSFEVVQRARTYKDLFRYKKSINDYQKYLKLVSVTDLNELGSDDYLNALSEVEFIYSSLGDTKNEYKYLKLRYDIIQQYNKNNLKLQAEINREVGAHYQGIDDFDKAIYHFNLSLNFIDKALMNDLIYSEKKDFYLDKELALIGKLDSEQKIKQDLSEYIKVYQKLGKMNDELKILDKSKLQYSILDTYYRLTNDYENRKINLKNAKNFVDNQIVEAKKNSPDWKVNFFIMDKRSLMFDEIYIEIDKENFDNALKLAKELIGYETNDTGISEIQKIVELRNIFGLIYSGKGKFQKAIDNFLIALEILNKSFEKDLKQETVVLNNLGLAYQEIGENELATKYLKMASIRGQKRNKNYYQIINGYNNLASLNSNQEDVLKYSKMAYDLFDKTQAVSKDSDLFVNTINFLGGYYLNKGIYEKDKNKKKEYYSQAKNYYDEVINYVEREMVKNIFPYSNYLFNYSDLIALYNKDHDGCINYQKFTTESIEKINPNDEGLIWHYDLMYACYRQKNENEKAFDALLKAMQIILYTFDQQNFELKFDSNYKSINNYKRTVHSFISQVIKLSNTNIDFLEKYDLRFLDLVFGLQQVIKSNKLTAKLSQSIVRQISKNEEVGSDLKQYTSLIDKKNDLLKLNTIEPNKIKIRNQKLSKLNKEIENLLNNILKKYPEIKKNFANQVVNGGLLQQSIPKDEVLIQYSVGNFGTYATLITSENYTVIKVNSNKNQLNELIKDVRNSLELENGVPKKFALSKSQTLYGLLFPNNMKELITDKNKLIIIPDGPLYGIPFELLHDQSKDQWLIEKYSISISPSAYSYVALNYDNNLKFNTGNSFLGFGDPNIKGEKITDTSSFEDILELEFSKVFTRGGGVDLKYLKMFPELPETAIELKKISKKFDENSKLYLRDEFNEEKINSINFDNYKVVSFASHALVVGEIDGLAEPSIVLSLPKEITDNNDGLLTASEIIELKVNSDLVILSACNTASSDGNANSEALSGLANSFFYSGAKSLIVTHWSVISKTSVDLMIDTFDFLKESNGDMSTALMKSKIKMLNDPKTSHPIYWAPYTLVGRMKTNIN